jgi:hypothetical protein
MSSVPAQGFETALPVPAPPPFLAVQALGASGQVLASSAVIAG